jgi:hypothetical protein
LLALLEMIDAVIEKESAKHQTADEKCCLHGTCLRSFDVSMIRILSFKTGWPDG